MDWITLLSLSFLFTYTVSDNSITGPSPQELLD